MNFNIFYLILILIQFNFINYIEKFKKKNIMILWKIIMYALLTAESEDTINQLFNNIQIIDENASG